jgi:hypothetical protein
MTGSRGQAAQATPLAGFWGTPLAAVPAVEPAAEPASPDVQAAPPVTRPATHLPPPSLQPLQAAAEAEHPVADAAVNPPTLLRPRTYLCANCAGRFPARNRPTPYCSLTCSAEAKAVRYARKQRAEHGDDLPQSVRILLQRKIMHALTECAYDKWSGQPEPDPVDPPDVHPLAQYVDPAIPATDTFALKHQELRARALAPEVLLPCDADDWDSAWRTWVNLQAR